MDKLEAVDRHTGLKEGMVVRGIEGEKLGRILVLEENDLTVEKGVIFPKDFRIEYDDIIEIRDGELFVNRTRESLEAGERPAIQVPIGAAAPYEHLEHTQIYQGAGMPPLSMADMDMDTPVPKEHPERPEIEPDPEMFEGANKDNPHRPRQTG